MGASGAAFRLDWRKDAWEPGSVDIVFMAADPLQPARRAVTAAGATGRLLWRREVAEHFEPPAAREAFLLPLASDDESEFRQRILGSIDAGVPVIGFGVVGPPEACIIAGYDAAGDTLIGWSMFQERVDPGHDPASC
jgi:hypothetical protein